MERLYHHSDSMYVVATKVYVKTDGYAYADQDCKTKIATEDLLNLFHEGMLIVDTAGVEYKPASCKVASNIATVTYVTADTSTPTTAKLATAKSI